jgi:hypothetical protein
MKKCKKLKDEIIANWRELQAKLEKQPRGLVYNILPLKVVSPLALPSSSKWEEGKLFIEEIRETIRCVEDIEESVKPLLERFLRGIFGR